mmetsp:Transcript_26452/g.48561  ORF Transcript_26452/g.48561 Transcript_26452/m.48561 type:complete len:1159 (-) Transcript_26452:265-3741(-)
MGFHLSPSSPPPPPLAVADLSSPPVKAPPPRPLHAQMQKQLLACHERHVQRQRQQWRDRERAVMAGTMSFSGLLILEMLVLACHVQWIILEGWHELPLPGELGQGESWSAIRRSRGEEGNSYNSFYGHGNDRWTMSVSNSPGSNSRNDSNRLFPLPAVSPFNSTSNGHYVISNLTTSLRHSNHYDFLRRNLYGFFHLTLSSMVPYLVLVLYMAVPYLHVTLALSDPGFVDPVREDEELERRYRRFNFKLAVLFGDVSGFNGHSSNDLSHANHSTATAANSIAIATATGVPKTSVPCNDSTIINSSNNANDPHSCKSSDSYSISNTRATNSVSGSDPPRGAMTQPIPLNDSPHISGLSKRDRLMLSFKRKLLKEEKLCQGPCLVCGMQRRPLRAKHCTMCKKCVHQFECHCPLIGNCIGRNNYRRFILFLFVGFLSATHFILTSGAYMFRLTQAGSAVSSISPKSPDSNIFTTTSSPFVNHDNDNSNLHNNISESTKTKTLSPTSNSSSNPNLVFDDNTMGLTNLVPPVPLHTTTSNGHHFKSHRSKKSNSRFRVHRGGFYNDKNGINNVAGTNESRKEGRMVLSWIIDSSTEGARTPSPMHYNVKDDHDANITEQNMDLPTGYEGKLGFNIIGIQSSLLGVADLVLGRFQNVHLSPIFLSNLKKENLNNFPSQPNKNYATNYSEQSNDKYAAGYHSSFMTEDILLTTYIALLEKGFLNRVHSVLLIIIIVFWVVTGYMLFGRHCLCISSNLTVNEFLNRQRYNYLRGRRSLTRPHRSVFQVMKMILSPANWIGVFCTLFLWARSVCLEGMDHLERLSRSCLSALRFSNQEFDVLSSSAPSSRAKKCLSNVINSITNNRITHVLKFFWKLRKPGNLLNLSHDTLSQIWTWIRTLRPSTLRSLISWILISIQSNGRFGSEAHNEYHALGLDAAGALGGSSSLSCHADVDSNGHHSIQRQRKGKSRREIQLQNVVVDVNGRHPLSSNGDSDGHNYHAKCINNNTDCTEDSNERTLDANAASEVSEDDWSDEVVDDLDGRSFSFVALNDQPLNDPSLYDQSDYHRKPWRRPSTSNAGNDTPLRTISCHEKEAFVADDSDLDDDVDDDIFFLSTTTEDGMITGGGEWRQVRKRRLRHQRRLWRRRRRRRRTGGDCRYPCPRHL